MDLLDELAAERDIRTIIAQYGQYADDRDGTAYAGLFTEDGALVLGRKRHEGRAAIATWLEATEGTLLHAMCNIHVRVESPTTAVGSLDAMVSAKSDSGWAPVTVIRYADTYAKTADGWRFAERILKIR
jgi:uncharacterized protein (TIGR02246 family)